MSDNHGIPPQEIPPDGIRPGSSHIEKEPFLGTRCIHRLDIPTSSSG